MEFYLYLKNTFRIQIEKTNSFRLCLSIEELTSFLWSLAKFWELIQVVL